MKLVFLSITGQTRRFVAKTGLENMEITAENAMKLEMKEPYLLIVPTYEPDITSPVLDFLDTEENVTHCIGIIGGGNRNFADLFIYTAKNIARDYQIPLLYGFEFNGTTEDIAYVKKVVNDFES